MSPVASVSTGGSIFETLSLNTWFLLFAATAFVSWSCIKTKKPKNTRKPEKAKITKKPKSTKNFGKSENTGKPKNTKKPEKPEKPKNTRNAWVNKRPNNLYQRRYLFTLIWVLSGQGQNCLSEARFIKSIPAVACLLFGLTILSALLPDELFSQFTLKKSLWVDNFDDLLHRNDVIPVYHKNFYKNSQHLKNSDLISIIDNRESIPFENEKLPYYMSKPGHVFLADSLQIERYFQANSGIPLKIAADLLDFQIKAKFPIYSTNSSDAFVLELKKW